MGPKLAESDRGDLVFINVVAGADDHHVSFRAKAVGGLAVDDLRANVRAALDLIKDRRLAAGDQERIDDAVLAHATIPSARENVHALRSES